MRHNLAKLITPEMPLAAVGLLAIFAVTLILPPVDENAAATDATTEVAANVDDIIAISAPTTLDLTVTPTADSATLVSGEVTVSVSTNSLYGYNLTMGTAGTDATGNLTTDLVNGENSATIPTLTSSATALDDDTWGFTTDNNTESDTIYGQVTAGTYLPLTTTASPTLIKGNTETVANDTTTVTFAASVTNNLAAGSYTNTVEFNAVANLYDVSGACFTTSENSDGTLSITSYDETCGTDVVIPATIMGKTVTTIAEGEGWNGSNSANSQNLGAFANRGITSVSLPDTLTTIGGFAFYRNSLTTVDIPDSVTYIGTESFKNNQISTLKLGGGLKTISALAFSTNQLTTIDLPDSLTYLGVGAFTKNSITGDAAFIYGVNSDGSTDYTTLNSYAGDFKLLSNTTLTIPDVETIGRYAFRDMSNSSIDVILPDTIQSIKSDAFVWCSFNSLTIPSSIQSISSTAFGVITTSSDSTSTITTVNIDRSTDAISGSPWGGNITTINWTGSE